MSRDEAHFGSDEDVDDGDNEVEEEGGAEDCDASGAKETQMNIDKEPEPAAAREGGSDATVAAESSQDEDAEREEKDPADKDVMTQEDDVQIKNKEDDLQPEHSEKRRDERNENVSVNTNEKSSAETQGDPLPTCPEQSVSDCQSEPQTVKDLSEEEQNRVASVDKAKLTSPAEPMETEPTGTGWTGNTLTIKAYVTMWQQLWLWC